MSKFIYDMIHMTEGEKLVEYWWLWVLIPVVFVIGGVVLNGILQWWARR